MHQSVLRAKSNVAVSLMVLLAQSVILSDVLFAVLEMNDTQLFARGRQSHLSNASESSGLSHILRLAQITYRAMMATHRAGN
jgi:hypothetical protein